MAAWLVRGRLAPSVHPFSSLAFPSHPSPPPFFLLAGRLERARAAKQSEAAAVPFLFLLLWWLDTTCFVLWRTVVAIALSVVWLLGFSLILGEPGTSFWELFPNKLNSVYWGGGGLVAEFLFVLVLQPKKGSLGLLKHGSKL